MEIFPFSGLSLRPLNLLFFSLVLWDFPDKKAVPCTEHTLLQISMGVGFTVIVILIFLLDFSPENLNDFFHPCLSPFIGLRIIR